MSLELARQIDRDHPHLLRTNLGSTCHAYTLKLIALLRARGHDAALMAKTRGEGQYVPPGFQPRTVIGLDHLPYVCTGVSHDAIWVDGKQVDTAASANEHEQPIYHKRGDPGWSFDPNDGRQITATPVWNEIPSHHWRPNNPPLTEGVSPPTPAPPTPAPPVPITPEFPYLDEPTDGLAFQNRVKAAYLAVQRKFPDEHDADAFRHFIRLGYDLRRMPARDAMDKRIRELRQELGAPPE